MSENKQDFSFSISPFAWVKRSPHPDNSAIWEWGYDMGYMMCILYPLSIVFFWMIRWFSWIRIPHEILTGAPELGLLFMGMHYFAIKCYPYLKKINKFTALFFIRIFPFLIIFESWGYIISDR